MNLNTLCDQLSLDGIVGLDWETTWGDDFTLSKMATTEYVLDPRFDTHMISVQWHDEKKAHVLSKKEFTKWSKDVDWSKTGLLAHHTHFDGLIASAHFKINPAFYLDTLSMGRAIMPVTVGGSLDKLCKAMGLRGKRGTAALLNTKNKTTLTQLEYDKLAAYAGNDIEQTWLLFKKLLPYLPFNELYVIDSTVRMYAQPRLLIDGAKVDALHQREIREKAGVLKRLRCTAEELRSKNSFARMLREAGVEPPTKQNKKDQTIFAFSKQDLEFKALLGHESAKVRALTRGRLRLSSSILEKRAQRMLKRAPYGAQPIYLNYAGALTFRWSGGDKCLAGDTKIRVKRAAVVKQIRLDELRAKDLVWDGETFVAHGGLVCNGVKETIEHQGIRATPDHKVYFNRSFLPIPMAEAKQRKLLLQSDYGFAYWSWLRRVCQGAKDRCVNSKNAAYKNYGGRGVTFGFQNGSEMAAYVQKELGKRPSPSHSIDRTDNYKGYEPGNLRWATRAEQARNKREYIGNRHGVRARKLLRLRQDLCYETIRSWIVKGLSDAEIMTRAKNPSGRKRTATTSPRVGDPRHA